MGGGNPSWDRRPHMSLDRFQIPHDGIGMKNKDSTAAPEVCQSSGRRPLRPRHPHNVPLGSCRRRQCDDAARGTLRLRKDGHWAAETAAERNE